MAGKRSTGLAPSHRRSIFRPLAIFVCLVLLAAATAGLAIAIIFRKSEISDAAFAIGGFSFVVFGLGFALSALSLFRSR